MPCCVLQVSTAVHELVGGVVDHVPTEEQDLSETAVMLQKLYSMNLIAYEGSDPNMEFWEVRPCWAGCAGCIVQQQHVSVSFAMTIMCSCLWCRQWLQNLFYCWSVQPLGGLCVRRVAALAAGTTLPKQAPSTVTRACRWLVFCVSAGARHHYVWHLRA